MTTATATAWFTGGLILLRWATEFWLGRLNERHVRAHAGAVPEVFRGLMDEATYQKSVEYTLARARFGRLRDAFDAGLLVVLLFSGVLPWAFAGSMTWLGSSAGAVASFLFLTFLALGALSLPFDWHAQFCLEERFGFNTMTLGTWLLDRVKGVLIAGVLGWPLLLLLLKLAEWTGPSWWLWAWAVVVAFQFLMLLLGPAVLLPLFNKFTPLPEGPLRERLFALSKRTQFPTRSIDVMDGSKRSRHSNAFLAGFGRYRRIVLFDTLIAQLTEEELEAVLAHEIGHHRRRHIPRLLAVSVAGMFVAFAALGWLVRQDFFYRAFGFTAPDGFSPAATAPVWLLFGLLAGVVGFWASPLMSAWSRRFEYEADAYAAEVMRQPTPLIGALRKLNEKNLSNLTPHPLYSRFYYSHPTLLERERALTMARSP